jgi:hypothetical protein
LFTACLPLVYAQEIELDLYMDAFSLTSSTYDHTEIRGRAAQDNLIMLLPFSNVDYWTDSSASIEYGSKHFGGKFSLTKEAIQATGFGKMKGWVQFGFLRLTAGNDIESVYADALDADPGLRLYTGKNSSGLPSWTSTINPDNITRDEGFLAEFLFSPLTIALAAGDFKQSISWTEHINNTNIYGERKGWSFRYGGRAGYELGEIGKLNLSYILEGKKIADSYGFKQNSREIVPIKADAEIFDHQFGLYGSFKLLENFDLTLGYNGDMTVYLDEFYNGAAGMVKTGQPMVFKNGANVNLRYKAGALTLRNDNSVSFWTDKDYQLFETSSLSWRNYNLEPAILADNHAAINHFILWNGIGASYDISRQMNASVYARNLISSYNASGAAPGGDGEYSLLRDQINVELKGVYKLTPNAEVFVKIIVEDTITSRSRDLNGQSPSFFIEHIDNNTTKPRPAPVATMDNVLSLRIPIGLTVKF